MRKFNTRNPWQAGLIAATALSAVIFYASLLSQAGNAEWAFLLLFLSVWCLIALFWANDGFNEESGIILAEAMDQNVEHLNNRLVSLEKELRQLRTFEVTDKAQSPQRTRLVITKDRLV
jgi:hypothetical protein